MRLKVELLVLIISIFTGIFNIAYAEEKCDVSIHSVRGISVAQNKAVYSNKENLFLDFDLLNTSEDDINAVIELDVLNAENKVLSNTEFTRIIKAGRKVPIKISSSQVFSEEDIKVRLNIRLPEIKDAIYVSETGADTNSGTYRLPFRSIKRAVERIEEMNGDEDCFGQDVLVIIEEGKYLINDQINFEKYENLNSVKIMGTSPNSLIYSGLSLNGSDFTKVTNPDILSWFPENVHDRLYSVNLVKYGYSDFSSSFKNGKNANNDPIFTQLYVNAKNAQIARYPNEGYALGEALLSTGNKITEITSDSIKAWKHADEAWIRGWFVYDWDLNIGYVNQLQNNKIIFDPNGNKCHTGFSSGKPGVYKNKSWYIYNLPDELDAEGEYIIYQNSLYYYPREEEITGFEKCNFNLNVGTNTLFNISDTENLTIEGLTFENANGYFINADADNLNVFGCTFRNNSSNAVKINGDNNLVYACDFLNLGGRGLELSGGNRETLTPSGSLVDNCLFDTVSQIKRTNCSPLYIGGCGTVARNNTIRNNPHSSVGFGGNDNIMEYNDVYNGLTDGSTDAGLFYAGRNLANLGNEIRYNYIHDSNGGLAAVYYDDFLSNQHCNYNLFERMDNGNYCAVFIHAGVNNEFKGNIVSDAAIGVRIRGKGTLENGFVNEWNEANTGYTLLNDLKTLPWKSDIWQKKYGETLKFVNNKRTRIAEGNSSSDNIFINVTDEIYSYDAGQKDEHLLQDGNRMLSEFDDETARRAESLRASCGIYYDSVYRPNVK